MSVRRTTVVQFLVLFAFWITLSGRFEPLFLGLGVLTALVVTALTHEIAGTCLRSDIAHLPAARIPLAVVRGVGFAGWMAGRVFVSSLQLAAIAVSPRMPLEPCVLRFHTELRSPLARTVLANSISLVPGTLTVDIDGDLFVVHALAPSQAEDLIEGRMQNRVAAVFLEAAQPGVDPANLQREGFR